MQNLCLLMYLCMYHIWFMFMYNTDFYVLMPLLLFAFTLVVIRGLVSFVYCQFHERLLIQMFAKEFRKLTCCKKLMCSLFESLFLCSFIKVCS